MFIHYLKTALRSLARKKMYAIINIFGLAVGLASCLLIIGHISYECSFEGFHANRDHICRVEGSYASEDTEFSSARVMAPLGRALAEEVPEVEAAAVFRVDQIFSIRIGDTTSRIVNEHEGAGFAHGNKLIFADASYFDVFTFPLLSGNIRTALAEPYSVLITDRAAKRYFAGVDPVGQVIGINGKFDCKITGIIEDIPQNTQLYSDFIVSYATLERIGEDTRSWNEFGSDYAYLLLRADADHASVETKIASAVGRHLASDEAGKYRFRLKPLKEIYFGVYGSGNRGELYPAGEISMMYEIGMVALFVLLQAIANFVNLSTARSADRMKEVGVRKVVGASRLSLMKQYLGETILIAAGAMVISVVVYEAIKLSVQASLPRQMMADFYNDPMMLAAVAGLIVVVGIAAGFYPALYLSRFRPMVILQRKTSTRSSRSILRKVLVVFQFGVAAVFIFCTLTIMRQTNYITSIKLGYATENMLVLDFSGEDAAENCRLMKNVVLARNRVLSATMTDYPPGRDSHRQRAFYRTDERRREDMIVVRAYAADADFIPTFDLNLTGGRNFSGEAASETGQAIIISEATAKELGVSEPVGTIVYGGGERFYEIIGVVEDFYGSPMNFSFTAQSAIMFSPDACKSLVMQLPPGDPSEPLAAIRRTWETTLPGLQFDYRFLDDEINANYNEYRSQSKIFLALAVLTVAIACLGIFGLVSYTAEQRTKEIGIRKVLGASVPSIVSLLIKEFLVLIVIANAVAWPIGYLIMSNFLKWFPFRVSIGAGSFAFVGIVAVFFAMLTAGWQSFRAGRADPVDSLRCE